MIGWIIGGTLIFLFVLPVLCALIYTYNKSIRPPKEAVDPYKGLHEGGRFKDYKRCRMFVDELLALPIERITVKAYDGITLCGYYHHVRDGAPVELLFHGFRSTWRRDFAGIARNIRALGHNILFVDQRAHGDSEGSVISYGIRERFDVISWINYIGERFGKDTPVVLVGVSMGAATALCAAGEKLPGSVKCVVADCPFSSAIDIITKVSGAKSGLAKATVRVLARMCTRLLGGFKLEETSAEAAVARAEIPVLLIHGDADDLVPYEMGVKIAAASPKVRFETFEGADHVQSYLTDEERYGRIFSEFINSVLND